MKLFNDDKYSRSKRWYLRGWQHIPKEDGSGSEFAYLGEWYGFALAQNERRCLKSKLLAGCLVYIVFYLLGAFFPSAGARQGFVAIPQILSIAFMIFMILGTGRILLDKERVPYSNYHAGYKRALVSWCLCAICSGITLLAELVYIGLWGGNYRLWRELIFIAEIMLYTADCLIMQHLLHRHPYVIVEGEKGSEYFNSLRRRVTQSELRE